MVKSAENFPPDRIAKICDDIATVEDPETRAGRIERMAKQCGVNEEAIQATFAHVKIRRDKAIAGVRNIVNERNRTLDRAGEGSEYLQSKGARKMAKSLEEGGERLAILREGLALLQNAQNEQDVLVAINKFAEAGDSSVLEVIADVYGSKRPDIAIEALLHAGTPDAALALAVQHKREGHRSTFRKLLGRMDEELS